MINKKRSLLMPLSPWLTTHLQTQSFGKTPFASLYLCDDFRTFKKILKDLKAPAWKKMETEEEPATVPATIPMDTPSGPAQVMYIPPCPQKESAEGWPILESSSPAWATGRTKAGEALRLLEGFGLAPLEVHLLSQEEEFVQGAVCGLEMAQYSFKGRPSTFQKVRVLHNGRALSAKDVQKAATLGRGVNWARHLVNLPPNELLPESYARLIKDVFQKKPGVSVEVWNEKKLAQENCGLHLSVGSGSASPPCLVILKYRPQKAPAKQKPIALVGKGITFDTGGLDLKPASGMRLMKKDMGGSAAVFGTFLAAVENKLPVKLNAYLALAENSVSSKSFRPSDLVRARNGKIIEIHNTDAEGRLVLADALDVATTEKEKPEVVIDVATLTGAIKVGLGSQVAGLFSNHSPLAQEIFSSCVSQGEDVWPMPLYQKYRAQMNTPFADMVNAVDGYGGAITAALFLESFVNEVPWAHLDIYGWKDAPEGAILEPGGSGQAVQGLSRWLEKKAALSAKK